MNNTLEDVKKFILEFTELEYQFLLSQFDSSVTDKEWEILVERLENYYSNELGYHMIITTYRDESLMTQEVFDNNKNNLNKKKLFLIRKYENPIFGKGIYDVDSGVVFSCFLGSNADMGAELYSGNLSVGIVNGDLKIISARVLNSEKRRNDEIIEWIYKERSNLFEEEITIKNDGTLLETLRVSEPEHPTWIADYNKG